MNDPLSILKGLVTKDTSTPNGANAALDQLATQLLERGLNVARYEFLRKSDSEGVKIKSIYVSESSDYKPKVLIIGHIDTVSKSDDWTRPPLVFTQEKTKEGDRAYGLGIYDMKAGLATMIHAAQTIKNRNVAYLIVTDEESGGFYGAGKIVKELSHLPDFVISPEPSNFKIEVLQKGFLNFKLHFAGRSAHSARPWQGINALEVMNDFIMSVKQDKIFERKNKWCFSTTFAQTVSECQNKRENQLPDKCASVVNIRYISETPPAEIRRVLSSHAKAIRNKYRIILEGETYAPKILIRQFGRSPHGTLVDCREDHPYVTLLSNLLARRDIAPELSASEGTSDVRFFADQGIQGICFGPPGSGNHRPDEYIILNGFKKYVEVFQDFVGSIK